MYQIHNSQEQSYLTDIVTQTAHVLDFDPAAKGGGAARMRLKFGERAFLYTAPDASNSLQRSLQQLSNTASVNNFENGH